jgi:hypothetical protein
MNKLEKLLLLLICSRYFHRSRARLFEVNRSVHTKLRLQTCGRFGDYVMRRINEYFLILSSDPCGKIVLRQYVLFLRLNQLPIQVIYLTWIVLVVFAAQESTCYNRIT